MPDILTKTKKELKWIKYKKFMKMIHTKSRNQMFWSFTRCVLIDTIRAICNSNNIRKKKHLLSNGSLIAAIHFKRNTKEVPFMHEFRGTEKIIDTV